MLLAGLSHGTANRSLCGAGVSLARSTGRSVNLDLEKAVERSNATLQVSAGIDKLVVAKKRPFGLATSHITPALQFRLAADVAVDVGFDLALSGTAGIALGLAAGTGWCHFTRDTTLSAACRFATGFALGLIRIARAGGIAVGIATRSALSLALKFAGVDLARSLAASRTAGRAACVDGNIAASRAGSGEVDGLALGRAASADLNPAIRFGADVDVPAIG